MSKVINIYEKMISLDNLRLADYRARKGKRKSYGVKLHDRNQEENIKNLHEALKNKTFRTSEYHIFKIYEPKERTIYRLPYYPDRIVHHAAMNLLEKVFMDTFIDETYSCIRGRGIHSCANQVKAFLRDDAAGTKYCLKLDIKKYYPSVDHDILKSLLRREIADPDVLWLLDEVIDSADGVPIGNYLSQYFANFYLAYFDRWVKNEKGFNYYLRYADDIVILSDSKEKLHKLFQEIRAYLTENLNLTIKGNWQVFPVEARGIDFVGYRFWDTHTLLRKSIKKSFCRAIKKNKPKSTIESYMGWAKHCDSKNLLKKLNV